MVNRCKPDYIGFVFADSKRRVSKEQAAELKKRLDPEIQTVGVFVDEQPELIAGLVQDQVIDIIQLHGHEDNDDIKELKKQVSCPVIKAIRVKEKEQLANLENIHADYLLLDAYSEKGMGGTGESFDWTILKELKQPYFLAGGLSPENVYEAVSGYQPYAVDVSSGVEVSGKKDQQMVQRFIEQVRSAGTNKEGAGE